MKKVNEKILLMKDKLLCRWGFHKWPTKDAIITMALLEGRRPYPLIRTCMRGCGRAEENQYSSQGEWWSVENRGLQKRDGPVILMVTILLLIIAFVLRIAL